MSYNTENKRQKENEDDNFTRYLPFILTSSWNQAQQNMFSTDGDSLGLYISEKFDVGPVQKGAAQHWTKSVSGSDMSIGGHDSVGFGKITLPKVSVKDIALDGSFDQAFNIVLASEGGFANHKADRGGATIFGIASKHNPAEYKEIMALLKAGDKDGALAVAKETYKEKYWDTIGADNISDPSARLVAFDASVNHGAGFARKMIARTDSAEDMIDYRATAYERIIENNPTQSVFRNGWMNRLSKLDGIHDHQVELAKNGHAPENTVTAAIKGPWEHDDAKSPTANAFTKAASETTETREAGMLEKLTAKVGNSMSAMLQKYDFNMG